MTFNELKKSVKKSIKKIPHECYLNYMKYAYKNRNVRKYKEKSSTRRRVLKKYKN